MTHCLFLDDRTSREAYIAVFAESFRPSYATVQSTLALLAEPVSRPSLIHEFRITPFSLGAAVSNGMSADDAISFLGAYSYHFDREGDGHPSNRAIGQFIRSCMSRYNLTRIVIENERTLVLCKNEETARMLFSDTVVRSLCPKVCEVEWGTFVWEDVHGPFPYFQLQSRAVIKVMAARCVALGIPIQQQYDYENDPVMRSANMSLKTQTKPRRYQVEAVEAATSDGILNSGCLLLPCGAGKTLVGIMLMCRVKKPTLVVCAGSVSVEQWKNQITEYASLQPPMDPESGVTTERKHQPRTGAARISCLTGKQKDDIDDDTDVVLTTYSMLVSARKAFARRQAQQSTSGVSSAGGAAGNFTEGGLKKKRVNPKDKLFASYGLVILDEVHVIPAEAFRESLSLIDANGMIGLTATYVREDKKIRDLFYLVGPKLYDVSMEALTMQGYLAHVNCVEVHTPMTKEFGLEYMDRNMKAAHKQGARNVPALIMLAAANPNKMLCVLELVHRHLQGGAKILVFCDHIMLLKEYGRMLNVPVICGETQHKDRLMVFSDFQSTSKVNTICISRVGDVSVNLPSANVVIQVSSHGGSRRQEAQRLGRILRPKERSANGKKVEAWFYSIISTDTLEMIYAAHRTAFLVDQGHTCRIMRFSPSTTSVYEDHKMRVKKLATKTDCVGDAVSIKQEELHSSLHGGGILQRSSTLGAAVEDIRSLAYQLNLLSKVISSWELDFQKDSRENRRRPREDPYTEGSMADVEVVEAAQHGRSFDAIRGKWSSEPPPIPAPAVSFLHDLVGVEDGFVYHEL